MIPSGRPLTRSRVPGLRRSCPQRHARCSGQLRAGWCSPGRAAEGPVAAAGPVAAPQPVLGLIRGLRDGRLTLRRRRCPRIAVLEQALSPRPARAGSGAARPRRAILSRPSAGRRPASRAAARAGHPRQRPATRVGQQVDLAGQPAPGPAQRLPVLVIRLSPSGVPGRSAQPAPAAPGQYPPAAPAWPRPRAGAPARPWHRPRPSMPGRRPRHIRPKPVQDHLPGPVPGPAAMPVINRLPVPEPLRQIPPRAPGTGPEEDPVQHQPVIIPPVPRRGCPGRNGSSRTHSPSVRSCRFSRSSSTGQSNRKRPAKIYGTLPNGAPPQPAQAWVWLG